MSIKGTWGQDLDRDKLLTAFGMIKDDDCRMIQLEIKRRQKTNDGMKFSALVQELKTKSCKLARERICLNDVTFATSTVIGKLVPAAGGIVEHNLKGGAILINEAREGQPLEKS